MSQAWPASHEAVHAAGTTGYRLWAPPYSVRATSASALRTRSFPASNASGAVRGPLLALGPAWGGGVGGRVDLNAVTLTAALDVAASRHESTRGTQLQTTEVGLRVGALRAVDWPRVTLALGAAVGVSRFWQSAGDQMLELASYAAHAEPGGAGGDPARPALVRLGGGVGAGLSDARPGRHPCGRRSVAAPDLPLHGGRGRLPLNKIDRPPPIALPVLPRQVF
jgi:hypothetical protein